MMALVLSENFYEAKECPHMLPRKGCKGLFSDYTYRLFRKGGD
jgi:hypothetical protein